MELLDHRLQIPYKLQRLKYFCTNLKYFEDQEWRKIKYEDIEDQVNLFVESYFFCCSLKCL